MPKLPSLKSAAMFFVGVVLSMIVFKFVPAEWKAKIGL